ncbi:hypothetical protein [Nocardioides sp.]|uniref:hypothetical protein n=1 Tax=Nocardioides sp. TaxID=35761 RepID=UPI0035688B45
MNALATTREQHSAAHINLRFDELEKDLKAVHAGIRCNQLTRAQAAVWIQLLIESAAETIADLEIFATRGKQ